MEIIKKIFIKTVFVCLIAVSVGAEITQVHGTADLELDNVVYAVGMGNDGTNRVVGGVTFVNSANSPLGVAITGGLHLNDQIAPPNLVGGTTTEDALEALSQDGIYGNGGGIAFPVITFDTVAGTAYRLQILAYDTGYNGSSDLNRNFDVLVDGILKVENELIESDPATDHGALVTIDFAATSTTAVITFGLGDSGDVNPVVSGITLAAVPEPATIILLGIGGVAAFRRRLR